MPKLDPPESLLATALCTYHFRLLIRLGEGRLRVRVVKDDVASQTLFDTPPVGE